MNIKTEDIIGIVIVVALFVLPALKSLIVGIIRAVRGEKEEDD